MVRMYRQNKCSCYCGEVRCSACGGSGEVSAGYMGKNRCLSCGGSGTQRCSRCGGTGLYGYYEEVPDAYNATSSDDGSSYSNGSFTSDYGSSYSSGFATSDYDSSDWGNYASSSYGGSSYSSARSRRKKKGRDRGYKEGKGGTIVLLIVIGVFLASTGGKWGFILYLSLLISYALRNVLGIIFQIAIIIFGFSKGGWVGAIIAGLIGAYLFSDSK